MSRAHLLLGCLLLFAGACGSREEPPAPPAPPNPALGKWQGEHGGTMEFRADGTATIGGPHSGKELHYRVVDVKTLEMTPEGGHGKAIHLTVEAAGKDELLVTGPKGTHKMHRVK